MPSPTFAHSFPARSPRRSRILVLSLEIDIFRMSELPTMGIGGLLSAASAILRRSVADRGAFVWSVLIATLVLVLAGCSAMSPYSSQANNPNPNQTAGVTAPTSAGQAAAPATSYAAPASAAQQDYSDSLPYPKQSLADLFRGSTQTQAPSSNPNCAASAEHLRTFRPALLTTTGPATLWRPARQSGSHGLAAVPQTIADRSFLEQIAASSRLSLISTKKRRRTGRTASPAMAMIPAPRQRAFNGRVAERKFLSGIGNRQTRRGRTRTALEGFGKSLLAGDEVVIEATANSMAMSRAQHAPPCG